MPKKTLKEAVIEALAKPRPAVKKIKKVTGRKKKK